LEEGQILLFGEAYKADFDITNSVLLENWLKLSLLCPDYKQASDWLVKYGKTLF